MPRKTDKTYLYEQGVFPTRLRQLMEENNVTQKALAEVIGMRPQTVSLYTAGQSAPDIYCLLKIADYFEVSTDWLLGRTGSTRNIDPDLAGVCKYTGLSEKAIFALSNSSCVDVLDFLLRLRFIEDISISIAHYIQTLKMYKDSVFKKLDKPKTNELVFERRSLYVEHQSAELDTIKLIIRMLEQLDNMDREGYDIRTISFQEYFNLWWKTEGLEDYWKSQQEDK